MLVFSLSSFVLILKHTFSPVNTEFRQIHFESIFLLNFFEDNVNHTFYCSETTLDNHLDRLSKKTENLIKLLDSLVEFEALKNKNVYRFLTT